MAKKSKFYVVWTGVAPGIYSNWDECKKQVDGYIGAQYKSFESKSEAEIAFKNSYYSYINSNSESSKTKKISSHGIDKNSICVDAACSGNPGIMEYRCVDTTTREVIFHRGPYHDGTNNIGEFLALVLGIATLMKSNPSKKIIYTDSQTAISWVKNKKAKTKLELTSLNSELFEIIGKAELYLNNTTHNIEIRKWETEVWGEIPADFGRK